MRFSLSSALSILYFALPLAVLLANGRLWKRKRLEILLMIVVWVLSSGIYMLLIHAIGLERQAAVDQFDLNGNGMIDSPDEETPGAVAALQKLSNDTGSTLAPFVAVPATAVWVGANYLLFVGSRWIVSQLRPAA